MGIKGAFDVVIVGAGAGGAAMAWRLVTNGAKVLLLEAGPRFDPAQDYPLTEPGWERAGFAHKPHSTASVTYGDLGRYDPGETGLASWNAVSGRIHEDGARRPVDQAYGHVQGVGGTTLHFVGEAHRLHPDSMALRTRFDQGADWPLTYADLEPYYTICESLIGVAGPADQGARWRSAPFVQPAHPLSPAAKRLQKAGAQLGQNWQANSRAALSQPRENRPACNYCGNCSRGCPIGDKGSADVTFIADAEDTGRLVIREHATVEKIHLAPDGQVAGVSYIHSGTRTYQETPVLVLAAGAVQTPRLLLASASGGVSNSSGQVGRNFMETLAWTSTGLLEGLENSHMGLPADAICWDYNQPDSVSGVVGGCRFNSAVQEIGFTGPIAYATRAVPGFGAGFKHAMRRDFGRAISVGAIGEVIADARSFVGLDPQKTDFIGQPLPVIHSVLTQNSVDLLRFMARQARRVLAQAGVRDLVEEYGSYDRFSTSHVFGTCRMGHQSDTSVVNGNCRSHDHPNLYISDASVFASSGGGESPSLTIQALAVRAADHIIS